MDGTTAPKHPFISDRAVNALQNYKEAEKLLDEQDYEFFDKETFLKDIPGIPVVQVASEGVGVVEEIPGSLVVPERQVEELPAQVNAEKRQTRKPKVHRVSSESE